MANTELMTAIRSGLQAVADPIRAAGAQAYLKSEMPSLGVRVPSAGSSRPPLPGCRRPQSMN